MVPKTGDGCHQVTSTAREEIRTCFCDNTLKAKEATKLHCMQGAEDSCCVLGGILQGNAEAVQAVRLVGRGWGELQTLRLRGWPSRIGLWALLGKGFF
jgi:hypothetical protein